MPKDYVTHVMSDLTGEIVPIDEGVYPERQAAQDAVSYQEPEPVKFGNEYGEEKQTLYPSSGVGVAVVTPESKPASGTQTTSQVQTEQAYQPKYDWGSGMSLADAYNKGQHTQAEIIEDRRRWGKENNDPINYFEAAMLFPNEHDINKTKTQNEEDIKRAARKEKMDQIGNFLAHLGNFVGTAGFGGMDIKPEDPVKFTERQRQIRDKTIALRNAYNKDFFSNMAKMQSEERLAENARAMQALKDAQAKAAAQKADNDTSRTESRIRVDDSTIKKNEANTRQIDALTPVKVDKTKSDAKANTIRAMASAQNAGTASRRESRMAQGTTTEETKTDRNTRVVKRRPGTGGAASSAQSEGRKKVEY